jgi:GNAT superfamily N-acetyltransferase
MEIRSYQPGDEKHILELFVKSFGKPLTQEYWKWRFADHPEKKMMIMLMWDGEILAGHYAVSPVRMIVDQTEILTALSMTTMTHPDYAGRGIFTQLAESLYEQQRLENDLVAVWGFPNNNSHYGFVKNVQWQNLVQIPTFSVDANIIREAKTDITTARTFSEQHTVKSDYASVRMKRDVEYLNWRYHKNPSHRYIIFEKKREGETFYAVTKQFPSFEIAGKIEVDILEWETPSDQKMQEEFLYAIKTYYSDHDLFRINMWMPLDDPRHIQLEKVGFRNLAPITYSGVRLLNGEFVSMLNANAWHYSLGYSDIY